MCTPRCLQRVTERSGARMLIIFVIDWFHDDGSANRTSGGGFVQPDSPRDEYIAKIIIFRRIQIALGIKSASSRSQVHSGRHAKENELMRTIGAMTRMQLSGTVCLEDSRVEEDHRRLEDVVQTIIARINYKSLADGETCNRSLVFPFKSAL